MKIFSSLKLLCCLVAVLMAVGCSNPSNQSPDAGFTLWQFPSQTKHPMMSYLIRSRGGKLVVIDGGRSKDAPMLAEVIATSGNHVSAWFLTHVHSDHFGGLTAFLMMENGPKIDHIYGSLPTLEWIGAHEKGRLHEYSAFLGVLNTYDRQVEEVQPGQLLQIDDLSIRVLGAKNPEITTDAVNNSSVVLRIDDGIKSVLFLGDLGMAGGEKLLSSALKQHLPAEYVQVAHHGRPGPSQEFYAQVNPRYCLWPTTRWLYENDNGGGPGSGPWKTLEVRRWLDDLGVEKHYVSADGLQEIR